MFRGTNIIPFSAHMAVALLHFSLLHIFQLCNEIFRVGMLMRVNGHIPPVIYHPDKYPPDKYPRSNTTRSNTLSANYHPDKYPPDNYHCAKYHQGKYPLFKYPPVVYPLEKYPPVIYPLDKNPVAKFHSGHIAPSIFIHQHQAHSILAFHNLMVQEIFLNDMYLLSLIYWL